VQILMVVLVAVVGVVSPIAAQHGKIHRVAILLPFATEEAKPYREAFFEGMRELGYVDGRNVVFDVRTSDRDRRNVPSLVMELIAVNPDVLVSDANAIHAIRAKTTSIPIVLAVAGDPVRDGYASSLRRPGLNVTGSAIPFEALAAKHVEIMREIRPRLARVALLFDTTNDRCTPFEQGAQSAARLQRWRVIIPTCCCRARRQCSSIIAIYSWTALCDSGFHSQALWLPTFLTAFSSPMRQVSPLDIVEQRSIPIRFSRVRSRAIYQSKSRRHSISWLT
jgi:hypothetical protein